MTARTPETDDSPPGSDELIRAARERFLAGRGRSLSGEMVREARARTGADVAVDAAVDRARRAARSDVAARMTEAASKEAVRDIDELDVDLPEIIEMREAPAPGERPAPHPAPSDRPEPPPVRSPETRRPRPPRPPPARPRGPFEPRTRTGAGPRTGLVAIAIAVAVLLGMLDNLDLDSLFDSDGGAGNGVTTTVAPPDESLAPGDWIDDLISDGTSTRGLLEVAGLATLEADHVGTVEFTRNGAVLDCDGHEIQGTGSGSGIRLEGVRDAAVTNCVLRGFDVGIVLVGGGGNRLEGNRVVGAVEAGIRLDESHRNTLIGNRSEGSEGVGILLLGSTRNLLIGNEASESGADGFRLGMQSNDNTLSGNLSDTSASGTGFSVSRSAGNTFSRNTASDNSDQGFAIMDDAEGTVLADSEATGNGGSGFLIASDGNRLQSNVASTNAGAGFEVDAAENEVRNNRSASNGTYGIIESGEAIGNTYEANVCTGNRTAPSRPAGLCSG